MVMSRIFAVLAAAVLSAAACSATAERPLVDPFPLRFPLVEVGALEIEGHVVGQPWAKNGVVHFATSDGALTAVVIPSRAILWRRPGPAGSEGTALQPAPAAGGSVQPGPETPLLRVERNRLGAFDAEGGMIWEFNADDAIVAEPTVSSGRVCFGTADGRFYCLRAGTGKTVWSRRLQGAPVHPAVVSGGTVVVAASNSVVYFLSARGGSILSWEPVPSRVVYPPTPAGPLVLISSASRELTALEVKTRKRAGQHLAPGPLAAGAVWSPPHVVLFVEDEASGRQRLIFLRSR